MKRYSVFQAMYLCFFSADLYRDVARNWRGLGLTYLLLLVFIFSLPATWFITQSLKEGLSTYGAPLVQQFPTVTIRQGQLSIDRPQPYIITGRDEKTGANVPIVIFDNTGRYTPENTRNQKVALVTATEVHIPKRDFERRVYSLAEFDDIQFGSTEIMRWMDIALSWMGPFLWLSILVGLYIFRILQVLFYGFLGIIINKLVGDRLDYAQLVRLSVVASRRLF
jgi:hypothetical protein